MLEFVLFHEQPVRLFQDFLEKLGLPTSFSKTDDCYLFALPDDLDEALWDQIEDKHAELMEMNQSLYYDENPDETPMASVVLTLKDQRQIDAIISPDVLMRILSVISHEELDEFAAAIVTAVENPDASSFCDIVLERILERAAKEKQAAASLTGDEADPKVS